MSSNIMNNIINKNIMKKDYIIFRHEKLGIFTSESEFKNCDGKTCVKGKFEHDGKNYIFILTNKDIKL